MPTTISNITTRAGNGGPLTANQMDANINNIKAFAEATRATLEGLTNNDGSLSSFNGATILNGTVENTKLKNIFYAADTSSTANSIVFTVAGASGQTSLSAGDLFLVKANTANTGSVTATITINSQALSPITLKKNLTNNLVSGQIKQNEMIAMIYDGTNLQVISDSLGALANFNNSTAGSMISYGSTGAPAAVTAGSSGQILVSNGAAAPSFQNIAVISNPPLIEITGDRIAGEIGTIGGVSKIIEGVTASETGSTASGDEAGRVLGSKGNGSYWKAPAGVTKIRVLLQGAGGAGSSGAGNNNGGCGGGGGEYVEVEFDVASGDVYQLYAGNGGAPAGGNGEATFIKKVTGYTGTGTLNGSIYGQAAGGGGANGETAGGAGGTGGNSSSSSESTQLKAVGGIQGGAQGVPYEGATAGYSDAGGFGGRSYKGSGGFGAIGDDNASGKPGQGQGYGYGGTGGGVVEADQIRPTYGGNGWLAIYDITTS